MSARLSFQFFSGSSMRARNRLRCSSFEMCRNTFTTRVLFRSRCFSKSTIDRYRSSHFDLSSSSCFESPSSRSSSGCTPDDEHFFVVRTIEDADAAALGQTARSAPEEIMFQFFGAGLLEAEEFASLRIDPGHDVPDGAVLAGGVHALEDE